EVFFDFGREAQFFPVDHGFVPGQKASFLEGWGGRCAQCRRSLRGGGLKRRRSQGERDQAASRQVRKDWTEHHGFSRNKRGRGLLLHGKVAIARPLSQL